MSIRSKILVAALVLMSNCAWGDVFIRWTSPSLPPAAAQLGVADLVIPFNNSFQVQLKGARARGYRVYVEVPLDEAAAASGASDLTGIILSAQASESAEAKKTLARLRTAHPRLKFLLIDPEGKRPEMRGSLVVKKRGPCWKYRARRPNRGLIRISRWSRLNNGLIQGGPRFTSSLGESRQTPGSCNQHCQRMTTRWPWPKLVHFVPT